MSNNNGGKFFWGAMIGVITGAVLGVLFAPRSGKDTRKMLKEKSKEYAEKGKEIYDKEKKVVKEVVKNTVDKVSDKLS